MSATRQCPNGHLIDATWERCPYCPSHARPPVPKTRVESMPPAAPLAAAAPPPFPAPVALPPRPPPGARKTTIRGEEDARARATPVVGWLVVLSGGQKGEDFRIREGKNSIGSAPGNDIILRDEHISGTHANIHSTVKDGERLYFVVDLDSRNGTFLNNKDERVYREELIDADTVTFGTTVCKFKCI
jgi:hypothetical protein